MTEIINFQVAETFGRTFEIPMQKVKELRDKYFTEVNLSKLTPKEVAEYIWNKCNIDEYNQYEKYNASFESRVTEGTWYD